MINIEAFRRYMHSSALGGFYPLYTHVAGGRRPKTHVGTRVKSTHDKGISVFQNSIKMRRRRQNVLSRATRCLHAIRRSMAAVKGYQLTVMRIRLARHTTNEVFSIL